MKDGGHVFPPILPRETLPTEALVVVAHPDDEVIGIGGLLAFHGRRGDRVDVLHATAGGAGDPDARHDDIESLRSEEGARALQALGAGEPCLLGFEDGSLSECQEQLTQRLRQEFAARRPPLLYTFHGGEYHADHRTVARAACAARDALPDESRILLFGVNQVVAFGALYDYSDLVEEKKKALACFGSQLTYLDFASKVMYRDQAATVNVELPEITHAELVSEVTKRDWPDHLELLDAFLGSRGARAHDRRTDE